MSLALYGHPFSSYTQKVLIAVEEARPYRPLFPLDAPDRD